MTAKKVFCSTAAKLIVFLFVLSCMGAALFTSIYALCDWIQNGSSYHYRFESSFESAGVLDAEMSWMMADLAYALQNDYTQIQFDSRFADNFDGDYYARMGDWVLKNVDLTEQEALSSPYYYIARPGSDYLSSGSVSYTPFLPELRFDPDTGQEEWITNENYPENTVIMIRFTEEQADSYRTAWEEQRDFVLGTISRAAILLCAALIGYICLLFQTGRKGGEDRVYLVTIDRMYVEINLALLLGLPTLAAIPVFVVLFEIIESRQNIDALLLPAILLLTGALALSIELSLSLVRNLKNRSFIDRSLILRIIRWCWRTAGRMVRWTIGLIKRIWHGVSGGKDELWHKALEHYKTRNVLLIFLGYSAVLALLAMMFGVMIDFDWGLPLLLGIVWFVTAAWFLLNRIDGFERVVEALKRLRAGELTYKLTDLPAGVFASMADDINSLGDGMQVALQNEIRAERMKSELITNVSHDLKTPLTSILNYSALLCQQHLTPEEANDYAKIIHQKSLRLKNLTSDLFDISKVQSGAEQIQCERIDACTLVRQALGEQDKAIADSRLTLKVDIPEREVPIWADGKKMSRVMENLIGNCVKYALAGTRVFVSVREVSGEVVIELKNIANYAMDFDANEITERFVRGDTARSTEGSGLGLAIAKSYATACGGALAVDVDGDLFKVCITFAAHGI